MIVGAFGNVRIGWLKASPKAKFAIKTMKKAEIISSKHVDHIENEKKILERIVHPFSVSFIPIHSPSIIPHPFVTLTTNVYLLGF